ncbi:hypothetical protein GW17_00061700 [Ensete ventricosum]|nr:hypothetical protein GW17_00061700 [Ensete ventricosum]
MATASPLAGVAGHLQGGGCLQPRPPCKGAAGFGQAPCKGQSPAGMTGCGQPAMGCRPQGATACGAPTRWRSATATPQGPAGSGQPCRQEGRRRRSQGWPPLCRAAADRKGQLLPAQG